MQVVRKHQVFVYTHIKISGAAIGYYVVQATNTTTPQQSVV